MRKDAVDAEHNQRKSENESNRPRVCYAFTQQMQNDPPRQQGRCATDNRAVKDRMPIDAPNKLDDRGLDQKSQRWIWKGEIAIRHIAERHAISILEDVTEIPKNRETRILPNDDCRRSQEQRRTDCEIGPAL